MSVRTAAFAAAAVLSLQATAWAGHPLPAPPIDPRDGLSVSFSSPFWEMPLWVAAPVRAHVVNDAPRARRIEIAFETGSGMGRFGNSCRSLHAVEVEARGTADVELLVPLCTSQYTSTLAYMATQLQVEIDGDVQTSRVTLANRSFIPSGSVKAASPSVAISDAVAAKSWETLRASMESRGFGLLGSRFAAAEVPVDWRGWAAFSGVILSSEEWSGLEASSRQALLRWVATGGTLFVAGGGADEDHGLGRIRPLSATDATLDTAEAEAAILALRPPTTANLPDYSGSAIVTRLGEREPPEQSLGLLMIAYAIAVGPLNLWLCRGGRRHHVFWTTPLIASGTCVLLAGAILLQDGLGGSGHRVTAVVALPAQNEAVVLQEQASRTGVVVRSAFAVKEPIVMASLPVREDTRGSRYDERGETWSGDWFASRSVQAQIAQAVRPSRAALRFSQTTDAPTVVSTFAEPLVEVHVVDAGGRHWKARKVAPGAPVSLSPATAEETTAFWNGELAAAGPRLAERVLPVRDRRGWFYAKSTGRGFAIQASPGLVWKDDHVIVAGPLS